MTCIIDWKLVWLQLALMMVSVAESGETSGYQTTQSQNSSSDIRLATAKLLAHFRNVSVVKNKATPYTVTGDGELLVPISLNVSVEAVLTVNDAQRTMISIIYVKLEWFDEALTWNSSDYCGLSSLELPAHSVWTPEIYITNSLSKKSLWELGDTPMIAVHSNGRVFTFVDSVVETLCDLHLEDFPFDVQKCPLIFSGKYVYPILDIHINIDSVEELESKLMSYSSEWILEAQEIVTIPFYAESFQAVSLTLRRKTAFYSVCLLMPMMLASFLNPFVFLVPFQSGEKVSFLVTLLVSTSVFFTFFKDVMPRGLDSLPTAMKLLIGVIIESLLVLLATLYVMKKSVKDLKTIDMGFGSEHMQQLARPKSRPMERSCRKGRFLKMKAYFSDGGIEQPGFSPRLEPGRSEDPGFSPRLEPGRSEDRQINRCASRLLSPQCMDRIFFLLAFVGNVVFLCALYLDIF